MLFVLAHRDRIIYTFDHVDDALWRVRFPLLLLRLLLPLERLIYTEEGATREFFPLERMTVRLFSYFFYLRIDGPMSEESLSVCIHLFPWLFGYGRILSCLSCFNPQHADGKTG